MDFIDQCKQLSARIASLKEQIATEEATKNAFIMPFIQMLGYDVFNPLEVVPELDCDLIKKKGEKIDYAIMKEGEPIMLIECKHWQQNLDLHDTQLQKYFVASKAKFGVLTNGITYRFYTDLVKTNIMDSNPFLEIDLSEIKESSVEELKKFHKSYFDVDNIMSTANELKYISELKNIVKKEFTNPSPEFVKFFAKQVYEGPVTQRVLEQFTELVKRTYAGYVNDVMSERLNIAIKTTETPAAETISPTPQQTEQAEEPTDKLPDGVVSMDKETGITTTQEEMDAFYIVKAILRPVVDISRVYYRDTLSYFGILLDDNNRKPICRMYFNAQTVKYIATFDQDKKETRHEIKSLDDIYNYSEEIRATIGYYDKK